MHNVHKLSEYPDVSISTHGRNSLHAVKNGGGEKNHFLCRLYSQAHFFTNVKYLFNTMTSLLVTGDCISQKLWYFHRTTVKQCRVYHFCEGGEGISPAYQEVSYSEVSS